MNGKNFIADIREGIKEGKIDTEQATIISLGVSADLLENQHELGELIERIEKDLQVREQKAKEIARASEEKIISTIVEVEKSILNSRKTELEEVNKDIKEIKCGLDSNPLVRIGKFIKAEPKKTLLVGFVIMAFSNIWFIDSFRRGALLLLVPLGFPKEWVDLLTTG